MSLYQFLLRPLLFSGWLGDPETLHERSLALAEWLGDQRQYPLGRSFLRRVQREFAAEPEPRLAQRLWGLDFAHPLGLAAGFDKNGQAASAWETLGFGFAELGTATLHAQAGNPRPRLFRLAADEAVLNRMGFNNGGAAALAARLQAARQSEWGGPAIPLDVNLGKSKLTPLEEAASDYAGSFRLLRDWGDYFVVNVSSPNTPGLRSLQDRSQLAAILAALQDLNQGQKPLLVKIAPDLSWEAIDEVLALAIDHRLAGIVATNTTIARPANLRTVSVGDRPLSEEPGGLSGRPLGDRATAVIRHLYRQAGGRLAIVGVGGIFGPADAWEKIAAGASLIQVYTGLIYRGPGLAAAITRGLQDELDRRGLPNVAAAIGCEA